MSKKDDIIKRKLERLESIPIEFEKNVSNSQKQILKKIISLVDNIERVDGNILINKNNLKIISEIAIKANKIIGSSEYKNAVIRFIKEIDNQYVINNSIFEDVIDDYNIPNISKAILKSSKELAVDSLLGASNLTKYYSDPLKKILNSAVSSGSSFSDLISKINNITLGDDENLGLLQRYSSQIARDSFNQSDSSYTNSVNNEYEIEWYVYRGGTVNDSRDFCVQRNGKYFHKKEVESWGNIKEWAGRIPDTDSSTIFIYRGGYNCMHSIMATSIFNVPKDVILRNIDSGNYNPTDQEKELVVG